MLRLFDAEAISDRSNDSMRSESALALCFIAFFSREPESTSLENALGLVRFNGVKLAMEISSFFRTIVRLTSRTAVYMLILLFILTLIGAVYQHLAKKADFEKISPPGQSVFVADRQFHIHCMGNGPNTVILEAGPGATSLAWAWIQPEIAKGSRVCSYDRAGYGWSSPSNLPMDAINTSQQLHDLLRASNIPGPYILAGHSIGGAYVRMFAAKYPEDVMGLVLIDATNPSVLETHAEIDLPKVEDWTPSILRVLPYLAHIGVMRVAVDLGFFNLAAGLPPDAQAAAAAFLSIPEHMNTTILEYSFLSNTLKQIRLLPPQPDLPVLVIVADGFGGMDAKAEMKFVDWHHRQQRKWLEMSKSSSLQIIDRSDHISLMTNKLHAHEVANSIQKMIETVRAH